MPSSGYTSVKVGAGQTAQTYTVTFSNLTEITGITEINCYGSYTKIKRFLINGNKVTLYLANDSDAEQTLNYNVTAKGIKNYPVIKYQ